MTKNYDSVIFDMDGTLWDAVDSYCRRSEEHTSELQSQR